MSELYRSPLSEQILYVAFIGRKLSVRYVKFEPEIKKNGASPHRRLPAWVWTDSLMRNMNYEWR